MTIQFPGITSAEVWNTPTVVIVWWGSSYAYRRSIAIQSQVDLPIGHTIDLTLPVNAIELGKVRPDLTDVVIVGPADDPDPKPTGVIMGTDTIKMQFNLAEDIPAGGSGFYHVYYGDPTDDIPSVFTPNEWPVQIYPDEGLISYTRPEEDWGIVSLGEDGDVMVSRLYGAKATVEVEATAIAIEAIKNTNYGIAEVQLDDGPWEFVDLFAPDFDSGTVWEAHDLTPGSHRLRYRASGRSNPASRGTAINLLGIGYSAAMSVVVGGEEVRTSTWRVAGVGGGGA